MSKIELKQNIHEINLQLLNPNLSIKEMEDLYVALIESYKSLTIGV